MNRFAALTLVLGWMLSVSAGVSAAASPDPKDLAIPPTELARAKELVRRLGSEDYRDREAAQGELAKMKRLARPVLAEAAVSDENAEVRSRAARLLPRAEADELQARIDTFLADADGKFEHDLPAWKPFRTVLGADKPARDLYVEMLQSPPNLDLLVALDQPDREAAKAIADRRIAIYLRLYPQAFGGVRPGSPQIPSQAPSVADIAAVLFAEVLIDTRHIPRVAVFAQISAAAFLQQQVAVSAGNGSGPHGAAFKRLLAKWFDTRTHPDDLSNYYLINACNLFNNYPETTPLLRRVVLNESVIGYQKSQALMFLVQRNKKDEESFLRNLVLSDKERSEGGELVALATAGGPASLLTRTTVERRYTLVSAVVAQVWMGNNPGLGGVQMQGSCQLRDYALALLIVLSGQNLRDYGYDFQPGAPANMNQITYPNYAFIDDPTPSPGQEKGRTADEKREAAIQKWRAWEASVARGEPGTKPNPFRRIP